jgi:hypothetical protein
VTEQKFGQEIVNAIARIGKTKPFTTRQIATKTELADSVVRPVILRLLDSDLIERTTSLIAPNRGRAPNFLRVTDSSGWAELKSLCRKLDA